MKPTVGIVTVFACGSVVFSRLLDRPTPQEQRTAQVKDSAYTFQKNVLPLLQTNCNPCHFPGGKVYKKLPFDDSTTAISLGKKLNTRLKKKEDQAIINGWIIRRKPARD